VTSDIDARGQDGQWRELAPGIWVLTHPGVTANTGFVLGADRGLIIDTGAGPQQAAQILRRVRELTDLPVAAVNTHAHGDHYFGNSYLAAHGVDDLWATSRCREAILESGALQRPLVAGIEPGMAAGDGAHTGILAPNRLVDGKPVDLDLGGLSVTLFHLGRGHTDHDLLVGAGSVLFTGDLVEEGADPAFEDSFPAEWIRTLGKISALEDLYDIFVPGHGAPVDVGFVRTQLEKMRSAIRVTKTAMDEASVDMTKAIPILPYGPEQSRVLLIRLRALAHWNWLSRQD
jgi:glyoxylase-like metal-dependent hydrolase (beta-lactamase superfamily II)